MSLYDPGYGQSTLAGLEPKDRADGSRRLAFFTAAVASVNGRALQSLLARSRSGEFGEEARAATSHPFSDGAIRSTIKNLSAVFIYLVMVDQGPALPEWLNSFLSTSARALDRMVEGPTVKEILLLYEFVRGYDICSEAAAEVSRNLGISGRTKDFNAPVKQFLEGSQKMRSDILMFALTQPYEMLDMKLEELRPAR